MNSRQTIIVVSCLVIFLSGCSQIKKTGLFKGKQKSVLIPLKEIKTSLKTTQAWQVKTGNVMGDNKIHPYVDNNTIFVAGGSSATALQKSTGKQLWKTEIGESITAGVNGTLLSNPQNRKTLIPLASQIFIGTNSGNAISLDAKTGKIQWIERLSSEVLSVSASDNDRVVFRTADGKLHGLSSQTGELFWQRTQKTPALTQLGAGVPIIVSNIIIAGFDNGKIAAYRLQTGQPLWEVALAPPSSDTDLDRIVDIDGKIKALGNALFASSLNGSISGINIEAGKQVWSKPFSSPNGIDVNVNGTGLFSSDDKGNIWAIDAQTGIPAWSLDDLKDRQPSTPMLSNKTLVVTDAQGNIHFIGTNGKFVARQKGDPTGYSVEPIISGRDIYLMGKSGLLSKITL